MKKLEYKGYEVKSVAGKTQKNELFAAKVNISRQSSGQDIEKSFSVVSRFETRLEAETYGIEFAKHWINNL